MFVAGTPSSTRTIFARARRSSKNDKFSKKRNIIEDLNITVEESKLKIKVADSINCCICQTPVYNYREIQGDITCSYECESILFLSKQNRLLHEKEIKSFEFAMIRSQRKNNLDDEEDNMSVDSHKS